MARKRRTITKTQMVKATARALIGVVKCGKIIPDKRNKKPKYPQPLEDE